MWQTDTKPQTFESLDKSSSPRLIVTFLRHCRSATVYDTMLSM